MRSLVALIVIVAFIMGIAWLTINESENKAEECVRNGGHPYTIGQFDVRCAYP